MTEAFPWLPTATLLGLVPGAASGDASFISSVLAFVGWPYGLADLYYAVQLTCACFPGPRQWGSRVFCEPV